MTYSIKAHPTRYGDVVFRSRLEATWAAFFDLAGWKWSYEPIDLSIEGVCWTPDFLVSFPCGHSECPETHELYVEVKPATSIDEFADHIAAKMARYEVPHPALFGIDPTVTEWEMAHGCGGGIYSVDTWCSEDPMILWHQAKLATQYKSPLGIQ